MCTLIVLYIEGFFIVSWLDFSSSNRLSHSLSLLFSSFYFFVKGSSLYHFLYLSPWCNYPFEKHRNTALVCSYQDLKDCWYCFGFFVLIRISYPFIKLVLFNHLIVLSFSFSILLKANVVGILPLQFINYTNYPFGSLIASQRSSCVRIFGFIL